MLLLQIECLMPRSDVPTAPFGILPTANICPTPRLPQQLVLQVLSLSGEPQWMLRIYGFAQMKIIPL